MQKQAAFIAKYFGAKPTVFEFGEDYIMIDEEFAKRSSTFITIW